MDKEEKIERGMYFSDRCQFCGVFGEKVEPYLCPRCEEGIRELGYRKLPKDRPELREKIEEKLDKIGEHTSAIRGDWTDPRYDCRQIGQLLGEIRELISPFPDIPKDKPPLLSNLDYYWRKGLAIEGDPQDAAREVAQAQWDIWNKAIYGD